MSYRNDHDAAVARADALHLELVRLAAENESLRNTSSIPVAPPKRSSAVGVMSLAGGVLAIGAAIMFGVLASADPPARKTTEPVAIAAPAAPTFEDLRACARAIETRGVTDTRAPDLDAVARTEAPCRTRLHDAAEAMESGRRRDLVEAWAQAEDRLSNRISLIHEYYTSSAAARESFAAAPELWREYNAYLQVRNAAVAFVFIPENS